MSGQPTLMFFSGMVCYREEVHLNGFQNPKGVKMANDLEESKSI